MVPDSHMHNNKGDIQSNTNYRGIKLTSHIMKLWERVIGRRLRTITCIIGNQFELCGRSTIEAIYKGKNCI